jgi:putative membrane protein
LYARDELKKLASEKEVQLSSTLDKNTSLRLRSWRSCQALSSIANTMGDMVNDHKKNVNKFQKEADKGKDPDVSEVGKQDSSDFEGAVPARPKYRPTS